MRAAFLYPILGHALDSHHKFVVVVVIGLELLPYLVLVVVHRN